MVGTIIAMEPAEFQSWVGGGTPSDTPAAAGEKLFQSQGCVACHVEGARIPAPLLTNVFGKPVTLQSGATVIADEAYLRESIVNPQAKIVAGFQPVMPTFQGLVTEEQLLQLIAYIKSLSTPGGAPGGAHAPAK
jgi:cytochrome c oxidase subunit 2